jgi:sulfite exporter TauE/SafE
MLLLGLASGVHCVGMCGGIVAAFSTVQLETAPQWKTQLLFNAGRIASYAMAGALAGFLGGIASLALGAQTALYVLANIMLVLVGLHLAGLSGALFRFERIGLPLWRRLQPVAARLRNPLLAGAVWGWLPCGLVYGALAAAAFAGGAAEGALAMTAFGIGTLPYLLAAGVAAAGGAVLAFGAYGLAHAGEVAEGIRRGLFCL